MVAIVAACIIISFFFAFAETDLPFNHPMITHKQILTVSNTNSYTPTQRTCICTHVNTVGEIVRKDAI